MSTVAQGLTTLVAEAAAAAGHGDAPVDPVVATNNPQHGDYQSNFAFRLGKSLKTNPRALAEKLRAVFPAHPMLAGPPEVAGPGFLNFRLADDWLAADVLARAADPHLLTPRVDQKTMVIDYSSPNVAKRMHVGHLRSTVIGNAIHRLYAFLGWNVVADNHIGDWGTPFGKLIVAWREWRDDAAYAADPIAELQRLYVLFGDRAKDDPRLDDRARAETAKLQAGDPENRALWQQFVDASMREFEEVYERLDVHFSIVHGESFYEPMLKPLVDEMLLRGLAVHSEGAIIVPLEDVSLPPLLIRKSDGAALYGTTDMATVKDRLNSFHPDLVAIVTDIRQRGHFDQVFAASRKMGMDGNFKHLGFGMLRLPAGQIVATRGGSGDYNLKDVLDTAVLHARQVVDEKSGHLDPAERAAIAEAVGVGAIRYADLSQNPQSDIIFEWSKILATDGNTAPYLMYAYARCQSIFRKAAQPDFRLGGLVLGDPTERTLAIALSRMPEAIVEAAHTWRPNVLADHLFGLANDFAKFYGTCRVLGADVPAEVTQSRLSLVQATAHSLAIGLDLLGLRALDRM